MWTEWDIIGAGYFAGISVLIIGIEFLIDKRKNNENGGNSNGSY